MPTSRPNWVSLSPRSCLIWMPMMEKIVHTAKQTVKAMVDIHSARLWPATLATALACIVVPRSVFADKFSDDKSRDSPMNALTLINNTAVIGRDIFALLFCLSV